MDVKRENWERIGVKVVITLPLYTFKDALSWKFADIILEIYWMINNM